MDQLGQQLGHYQLQKQLGQGGMGGVYQALNLKTNRRVALKAVTAGDQRDPDEKEAFIKRFLREARIGEGLVHPNIARVYDSGSQGDWLYLVMEQVQGTSLRKRIGPNGFEPQDQALSVVQRIGMALDYAHDHGVIHRDIKPENILITSSDLVKLVDFGISKTIEDTMITTPGFTLGTPDYMSPEQLLGKPQDVRTDLFAFGILTHELLTGKRPFTGKNPEQVFRHVIHGDFDLFHFSKKDKDRQWIKIMGKILAPNPADRFDSAWNFLAALAEVFTGPEAMKRIPDTGPIDPAAHDTIRMAARNPKDS